MTTTPAADLLDIDSAAKRLAVPERFMRRLVAERRIPYFKVGKYVRFGPCRPRHLARRTPSRHTETVIPQKVQVFSVQLRTTKIRAEAVPGALADRWSGQDSGLQDQGGSRSVAVAADRCSDQGAPVRSHHRLSSRVVEIGGGRGGPGRSTGSR